MNLRTQRGVVKGVITRIARLRYLRVIGFAVGGVAVAGAAVLVTASASGLNIGLRPSSTQPSQSETTSVAQKANATAVCNGFIAHLSTDLGKTQAQVNAAIQKAIGEALADDVKNKDLTQAQADAIKARLGTQPPCALAGVGGAAAPVNRAKIGAYMQQLESAAASALGISDAQLKTDLANGMSLSQVAAAQKPPVSEADFRTRLIAKLKPLLDTAVTNKQLTSTQEQMILQQLQKGPIPLWNAPIKRGTTAPASPATT
jgi:hypothetical protein